MELEDMSFTALTSPPGTEGGAGPADSSRAAVAANARPAAPQPSGTDRQLSHQPFVKQLLTADSGGTIVFNSGGVDPSSTPLYAELSADHLVRL